MNEQIKIGECPCGKQDCIARSCSNLPTAERSKKLAEWDAANRKHINDLTDTPIKKLAVSSGIYDCITDPYDALKNGDQHSSVMPDLERFAELIIKECVGLIRKQSIGTETLGGQRFKTVQLGETIATITEHFGIKE